MSIQQSINQMLGKTTIAAGLYSQTPAGETAGQVRQKKAELKKVSQSIEEGTAASPTAETKAAAIASEIYNLSPSQKHSDIEEKWIGARDRRIKELENSKSRFKMRQSILLNQYGERMEVEDNGNK